MAVAKLTKTVVEGIAKGAKIWDTAVGGFGCRRQTTDAIWYLLRYSAGGRQRTYSIGRHGSPWTVETARTEAKRLLGLVASGRDPLTLREAEREERERPTAITFGQAVEAYITAKLKGWKPGTAVQVTHHLRTLAQPLHPLALVEIDRRRIAELLASIEENSGPVARNRTRTSLSAMFKWLDAEGRVAEGTNPAAGTAKADEAPSRERVLSQSELAEVWAALGEDHASDIIRLLLLTGQRRDEITKLRWSEIDFDRALLTLPPARTKNKRQHEVPLAPQALAILRHWANSGAGARANDGQVFDRVGWDLRKKKLDAAILAKRGAKAKPMAHWQLHDLRRTCATGMGELAVLPHVIECVCNHLSGFRAGVAGTYNRNTYAAEMRAALCAWADHIDGIVGLAKAA
jgi:integrase